MVKYSDKYLNFFRRRNVDGDQGQEANLQEENGAIQKVVLQVWIGLGEVYRKEAVMWKMKRENQLIKIRRKKWKDKGRCKCVQVIAHGLRHSVYNKCVLWNYKWETKWILKGSFWLAFCQAYVLWNLSLRRSNWHILQRRCSTFKPLWFFT